ncbi:MAG: hypothetical protein JXA38_04965 [Methanosarcinaceae archaeon]|nr:hypothetical protein [Methanosarcinaceae archaeon]
MTHLADAFLWWIAIEIIGIITLPIAGIVAGRLHDRGCSVSKMLGIVLVTYLTWMLSYLLPFSRSTVFISLLLLAGISAAVQKYYELPVIDKKKVLTNEFVFLIAFIFFLIVRSATPAIYGQEKFMDFAFLNSILHSTTFPPLDPWFAGKTLDFYYYFGYLAVALLIKITGIFPSVAFNLTVALIFALTINISYGIGYNLTKNIKYGSFAAIFIAVFGNIQGAIQFVSSYIFHHSSKTAYYWSSSRVIPNTINEFPYFSFIHGDLHAHMIAIPLQLLVVVMLLNLYLSEKRGFGVFENAVGFAVFVLCLGFLFPANTWDYPTYLAIMFTVLFAVQYRERSSSGSGWLADIVKTGVSTFVASIMVYLPFYLSFHPAGVSGIGFVTATMRTDIKPFLTLFGLFLYLLYSLLLLDLKIENKQKPTYISGIIALLLLSYLLSLPLMIILIPLFLLAGFSYFKERFNRTPSGFVAMLCSAGAVLSLLCELVFIRDAYHAPLERMNTVFKFYVQIWIMWSIAAFYAYYQITSKNSAIMLSGNRYRIWAGIAMVLILLCSVFPVAATITKTGGFAGDLTLDGMDYMKNRNFGDYYAIQWLWNISGSQVVLEAPGRSYSFGSRVSTNTGFPAVIGWTNHELVWRGDLEVIEERRRDVETIYETSDMLKAMQLIEKYNITYIYIGDLEKELYSSRGLEKFEDKEFFEPVYMDSVSIYKVSKIQKPIN